MSALMGGLPTPACAAEPCRVTRNSWMMFPWLRRRRGEPIRSRDQGTVLGACQHASDKRDEDAEAAEDAAKTNVKGAAKRRAEEAKRKEEDSLFGINYHYIKKVGHHSPAGAEQRQDKDAEGQKPMRPRYPDLIRFYAPFPTYVRWTMQRHIGLFLPDYCQNAPSLNPFRTQIKHQTSV